MRFIFLIIFFVTLATSCDKNLSNKQINPKTEVDSLVLKKADSIFNLGEIFYRNTKYQEAIKTFKFSDSLFNKIGDYGKVVMSKVNKSNALKATFNNEDFIILKPLMEALEVSKKLPKLAIERVYIYEAIASMQLLKGNYENTKFYYLKSLDILTTKKDFTNKEFLKKLKQFYRGLTYIEQMLFNFSKAEMYAKKEIEFCNKYGYDTTFSETELFIIYYKSNQLDKAAKQIKRIEEKKIFENGNQYLYNIYDYNIIKIDYYTSIGEFDKAIKTIKYLDSVISNSDYKEHFSTWYLSQRKADVLYAKGDYLKSIEVLDKMIIDPKYKNVELKLIAEDIFNKSKAYAQLNNFEKTKELLNESINYHLPKSQQTLKFLESINLNDATYKNRLVEKIIFKGDFCQRLYENTSDEKYKKASLENYKWAHILLKNIGASSTEDGFFSDSEFVTFYEKTLAQYYLNWQVSQNEAVFYEALTLSDESKHLTVLAELKEIRKEQLFKNIPKHLKEEEETLQKSIDSLNRIYVFNDETKALNTQRVLLEKRLTSLKNKLQTEHPNYYELMYGNERAISSILKEDLKTFNVLQYFVGNEFIYIFNINEDQLNFDKILFTKELKNAIDKIIIASRNPQDKNFDLLGVLIYESLLKKYIDSEKKTAVILDGKLNLIPFEALKTGTQINNKLLLELTSIVRLNSIKQATQINKNKNDNILIFAPFASESSSQNGILFNSLEEAKQIKNLFKADLKVDSEASKQTFLDEASNFAILHLATHSEINKNKPLKSTIYFSANNYVEPSKQNLQIEELYNMQLNSSLITLSSCETGIGKEVKGKGVMSISNAFNYAGVSSTVMSLWKVPDKETSQLMVSFYSHLKNGETKDIALQKAKLDYLKNTADEILKHPYYWAGFVISGDTSPIVISTPNNNFIWLVSGVLILAGVGFYFKSKRRKKAA